MSDQVAFCGGGNQTDESAIDGISTLLLTNLIAFNIVMLMVVSGLSVVS